MEIKIDTKEKFKVLTPTNSVLSDKIAQDIKNVVANIETENVKNVILNMEQVTVLDTRATHVLKELYMQALDKNTSFVICCIQPDIKKVLQDLEIYDTLNITPTESEAWDMVQMEEMEREMFGDE